MDKKTAQKQYQQKLDRKAPKSKLGINCTKAFLIGGTICLIGQIVLNIYKGFNLDEEKSAILTSVTMIFLGILLTGLDIYWKIARHGGAGTLVPITGFANAVSSPAIEAKTEGFVLGVGVKLFSIAGPVIAYGISASFIAGIIMFILKL